ncbi:hypothetical protein D3C72_2035730 [compost metagenome]
MASEIATVTKSWGVHDSRINVTDMNIWIVIQFTAQRFAQTTQAILAGGIGSGIWLCNPTAQ